mgnify:CR=1 FL=1
MERTVRFEPQAQEITPDKGETKKAPRWLEWTDKSPSVQPWAKIAKTEPEEPEARILKSRWIPPRQYELYEHLDHRWERTVWWSSNDQEWKSRDPNKPIDWARSPGWKPEMAKEAEQRRNKGIRLDYRDVLPGGIYRFFDNPDRKVRVERIYGHLEKPDVFARNLDGPSGGKFVFADELECTLLNSNRARKKWVRCRRAKYRKLGWYCFF